MDISIFSVIMAIIWFSVFAAIFSSLMRKNWFVQNFNIWLLVLLAVLCIARAVVAIELPNAKVIASYTLLPAFRDFLYYPLFLNMTVLNIIIAVWAIGSIFMLIRLIRNYLKFYHWLSMLDETSDVKLLSIAKEICGSKRKVVVYKSSDIPSPMLTGFFRPIVLMPDIDFPEEYSRNILLHEYSHFKNGDVWAKCLLNIICCLLWWHPLSYTLRVDLDHSLEVKCDTDIISKMSDSDRIKYFEMIKNISSVTANKPNAFTVGLVSARHEKQLIQRFQIGLNYKKKKRYLANTIFCIVLIAVFVFSYSFIFQSVGFPEKEPGIFTITPENAYMIYNGDGTYSVYVNDVYTCDTPTIEIEPFSRLPIIER